MRRRLTVAPQSYATLQNIDSLYAHAHKVFVKMSQCQSATSKRWPWQTRLSNLWFHSTPISVPLHPNFYPNFTPQSPCNWNIQKLFNSIKYFHKIITPTKCDLYIIISWLQFTEGTTNSTIVWGLRPIKYLFRN